MELNHLRYFYEVAKSGSFTAASKTLRVSQPSISKIIKILEDRENVKLFDRGKKGVTLTEAGRTFLESCQCIFQEIENLRANVRTQREDCVGDLSIGASDNLCNYVLPKLFVEFWKKYPRVRVNLFNGTSNAIKNEVSNGNAELGLFFTHTKDIAFAIEKLACVEFVIVCAAANQLLAKAARNRNFDPAILEQAFYIGSRIADYERPYPTLNMLKQIGVKPRLFFETNNQETQKRMALEEYGYTIVPRYIVKHELKTKQLLEIKAPRPIGADLYLIRRKNRTPSKPAQVFESYLKERLSKLI
jgi:DNA-binding transcriptional LysR family regulator